MSGSVRVPLTVTIQARGVNVPITMVLECQPTASMTGVLVTALRRIAEEVEARGLLDDAAASFFAVDFNGKREG